MIKLVYILITLLISSYQFSLVASASEEESDKLSKEFAGAIEGLKLLQPTTTVEKNLEAGQLALKDAIKLLNSVYKDKSEQEVVDSLLSQHAGSSIGEVLKKYPKLALFLAKVYKDPDCLMELARILENRQKLLYYFIANVATILFGWMIKRSFRKKDGERRHRTTSMKLWFLRFLMIYGARVVLLISFYGKNLKPLFNIILETVL